MQRVSFDDVLPGRMLPEGPELSTTPASASCVGIGIQQACNRQHHHERYDFCVQHPCSHNIHPECVSAVMDIFH